MSLAGFMKQINKASQFLSENVAGTKGSEIESEIVDLAEKLDVVNENVENLQVKTREFLQPNPNTRTLMALQNVTSQNSEAKYHQPEQGLAEVFTKYGTDLKDNSFLSSSLKDLGSVFGNLAEEKDAAEANVRKSFLDPLYQEQQNELKDIAHNRTKLESRRLDYDYKKRREDKMPVGEMQMAEDKFFKSKETSYLSMANYVDDEPKHIAQLHEFTKALQVYHQNCARMLETLNQTLAKNIDTSASQPKPVRNLNFESSSMISTDDFEDLDDDGKPAAPKPSGAAAADTWPSAPTDTAWPSEGPTVAHTNTTVAATADTWPTWDSQPAQPAQEQPSCRALYPFQAENDGEMDIFEGDMIDLIGQVNEEWMEGSCNGRSGYFPASYVEIVVPLADADFD